MKQVILRQGEAEVVDVPAPTVQPGFVLVHVQYSCLSVGTELSGLRASSEPLWRKALRQPEKIQKVFDLVRTQGITSTRQLIEGKLSCGQATGYSASGIVLDVGEGVTDVRIGDRVACAGASYAHHAEVIAVPRNLVASVPGPLDLADASTVTLGAIALQGVRRAQPTMGETFVVVGLGIIGQLTLQLLKAHGCRVVGMDLDPGRRALATNLGVDVIAEPDLGPEIEQVIRLTDGHGADGVIVCAATPSNEVIATAFQLCRRKGRVVLVGDVGLDIRRADIYAKELDFFISTSYGPGRYDARYEEEGLDYPIGYVRWTENRNMSEYLRLLSEGRVTVAPLVRDRYPIDEAAAAYRAVGSGAHPRPLTALLCYPRLAQDAIGDRMTRLPPSRAVGARRIRLALVGAGDFAKGVHLPNLSALADTFELRAVVSRTGHNAMAVAKQYGGAYASTEIERVLADPEIDAVLLGTRHQLHGAQVLAALRAGKHVFVEKPLTLSENDLTAIADFYQRNIDSQPVLVTGFNRRFSPYMDQARKLTAARSNPMMISYRVNAGHLPATHWTIGPEGGGRNLGEACHFYDLFVSLTGSAARSITVQSISPKTGHFRADDNFSVSLLFADGSVASLIYSSLGSRTHPKEAMEVFVDGKVLSMVDYQNLTVAGVKGQDLKTKISEKGHRQLLEAFGHAIQGKRDWPIPLEEQLAATRIAFEVEKQLHPRAQALRPLREAA